MTMNSADTANQSPPVAEVEEAIPTYSEAFPSLPTNGQGSESSKASGEWTTPKIQRIKSTVVTQIFNIPMQERAFKKSDFGRDQMKVCMDIMNRTDTQIEISTCRDGSLSLLVTGKSENVLKARREVYSRLQTKVKIDMDIPKDHHRFILGKGGARLKKLELDTATKINIPRTDDDSNIISISGAQEGINKASHEIQLISDEQSKLAMERLAIEKMYHPFICGPRNEIVNGLTKDYNVRIRVPPPSVMADDIVVSGEKDGVAVAVAKIMDIYRAKKTKCKTISVEIAKTQHKYIIGPKGQTLQDILADTGVSVELSPSDSLSETVVLCGEPEKLGIALTMVYSKANSVVIREVQADAWLHRYIIGKKGAEIQAITSKYPNVNANFVTESNKIVITGPPGEADPTQQELEKRVADLKANKGFAEVQIDPKFHRNIIGKGGQFINKLRDECEVTIQIPSDDQKSSTIRIEGSAKGVVEAEKQLKAIGDRLENERSKDILIEHRFHKNIIGQKGDRVKEIRERFPEVNISFPDANLKSDIVNLRGPKNEVEKCYKYLKQISDELVATNFRLEVPIFKQYHKNVIGKKGGNISKIREETGTQIELPTENSDSDIITIVGRKADCEKARTLIRAIEKEQADIVEEYITISAKHHNSLIGAKGRLIRSIIDDCGQVQIHFPQGSAKSDEVHIRGPAANVAKAKEQLVALAEQKELTGFTAEVHCKPELHRFLIGKSGSSIKKVREETDTRVIFPNTNDEDRSSITIIGKQADVEKAKALLEEQISGLENTTEIEMNIDQKYHKYFVARRGKILRDIADEFGGVSVSFPRIGEESTIVRIKGPSECVEGAKAKLNELVDDQENQVTIECIIDEKYHRTVIGQKGKNVQGITSTYNVQIKFPDRGNQKEKENGVAENGEVVENGTAEPEEPVNKNLILISGHKDKCQEAKAALESFIPITAEVEVPFKYHRYIIGQKGAEVRKLMNECDVNISIPAADLNSDIITVLGVADKVEHAKERIQEKLQEFIKEDEERALRNFTIAVDIPAHYHPQIIGRRGATVNELRKNHDVNIQLPDRDSAEQDVIKIIGYEANVESAKQAILDIVNVLDSHVSQDVHIDRKVHPRLIGAKGRSIKQIMNEYGVAIRFSKDEDIVTVTGAQDKVEECIEHILNLEEEYNQDMEEQEETRKFEVPDHRESRGRGRGKPAAAPFAVRNAPWHQSVDTSNMEDFPSLGSSSVKAPAQSAWGRRK